MKILYRFSKYANLFLIILGALLSNGALQAQVPAGKLSVHIPESSRYSPLDTGKRAHTHLRILLRGFTSTSPYAGYNNPSMVRSAYNLPSTGGSQAIAIVDSYHFPTALNDFNTFSNQYQLPVETSTNVTAATNKVLQVVYASGTKPLSGGSYISSWNLEAALDIEWAHAIAPNAKIYLVEAASDSGTDLFNAVKVAANLPGVKEVSMSWGSSEWYGENSFDSYFTHAGVVYLAAGGDSPDAESYPSCSPNVISCGGTSLNRNAQGGLVSESGWIDTGCGPSIYEPRPAYQNAVAQFVGPYRGANDMSFLGDPQTGVNVYDSTPYSGASGWWIIGGTSLSTPCLAGVLNLAGTVNNNFAASTAVEQSRIYGNLGNTSAFRDITAGITGYYYYCGPGYDFVTGVGSPIGLTGK